MRMVSNLVQEDIGNSVCVASGSELIVRLLEQDGIFFGSAGCSFHLSEVDVVERKAASTSHAVRQHESLFWNMIAAV